MDGTTCFRRRGGRSTCRTTISSGRRSRAHKAAVTELASARPRRRRHLRGGVRGRVPRRLRSLQARERAGQWALPCCIPRRSRMDQEKKFFFRLSSTSNRCSTTSGRHPAFSSPISGATSNFGTSRAARGHFSHQGGPVLGHPAAVGPERRGRLVRCVINYASAVGTRKRSRSVCGMVACRPSSYRKRHHAFSHGDLARDADERRCAVATNRLRAWFPYPSTTSGSSKSNPGTIIDPLDAAARHGVDPLRLYLVKEIGFGDDGDFSWDRFDERYNAGSCEQSRQPRQSCHRHGASVSPGPAAADGRDVAKVTRAFQ